ncbi:hypothetical protein CEXT_493711 [Caerostris extrusa]|uniref:Uncharacterized protein n=1 Tax=Caerostris extrusa TaxID=172846 RepID=A0AAV4YEK3_CAEEX|nr:hypothetical protein CEXT_493711 [Caerostris extrusa]
MDVGIERLCWQSSTNLFSEHFHKRRAMENPSPNFKHGTFSPASTTPNDSYYSAGDAKTIQLNKILCFILQLRINSPSCFVYLFEVITSRFFFVLSLSLSLLNRDAQICRGRI